MLDLKSLMLVSLVALTSCGDVRERTVSNDVFNRSEFFCMWVYGYGAETPDEIRLFNSKDFDESHIVEMAKTANDIGRLYLLLYAKYRDSSNYNAIMKMIHPEAKITYLSGCRSTVISAQDAIARIERAKFDWAGILWE